MPKPPIGLWAGIHLGKKFCTYAGEGPRAGQMRKKKPDYWSKVNRDLEELPCVNDVSAYLVSASLGRIPFLWLCISALLLFYSRVVHWMTGHLSSCMWNLRFWGTMYRGVSAPSCCAFIHRVTFEEVTGFPPLGKMRPLPATASQGKSPVPP